MSLKTDTCLGTYPRTRSLRLDDFLGGEARIFMGKAQILTTLSYLGAYTLPLF